MFAKDVLKRHKSLQDPSSPSTYDETQSTGLSMCSHLHMHTHEHVRAQSTFDLLLAVHTLHRALQYNNQASPNHKTKSDHSS